MPKMTILMGFIGSGKSTWAKRKANKDRIIINRDSIREMFFGKYDYDLEVENVVRYTAKEACYSALMRKIDVIIDEVNLTKERRKMWFDVANNIEKIVEIHVIHFAEDEDNVKRRMNDPRGISEEKWTEVFEKQKREFEELDEEEHLMIKSFYSYRVIDDYRTL